VDEVGVVRLLAEPGRLRVFAALVLHGDSAPSDVAAATGLTTKDIATALRKLADGGLVEVDNGRVRALSGVFGELARQAVVVRAPEDFGYSDQRVTGILRTFVRDGRLLGLPVQRHRRIVVLEHVAQSFDPGVDYPEREVDRMLLAWVEGSGVDHVSLRRYLIDERLLGRTAGVYRRSGGWTDVSA
jgi:hypothetical protein